MTCAKTWEVLYQEHDEPCSMRLMRASEDSPSPPPLFWCDDLPPFVFLPL